MAVYLKPCTMAVYLTHVRCTLSTYGGYSERTKEKEKEGGRERGRVGELELYEAPYVHNV
jgi:hypothetical protein